MNTCLTEEIAAHVIQLDENRLEGLHANLFDPLVSLDYISVRLIALPLLTILA